MPTTISGETPETTTASSERTLDKLTSAAHRAVDKAASAAAPAEGWIRDKTGAIVQKEEELVTNVVTYVREHPVAALGIAAAAGFLIGMLSHGGSDD